jgi:hypothetical protein
VLYSFLLFHTSFWHSLIARGCNRIVFIPTSSPTDACNLTALAIFLCHSLNFLQEAQFSASPHLFCKAFVMGRGLTGKQMSAILACQNMMLLCASQYPDSIRMLAPCSPQQRCPLQSKELGAQFIGIVNVRRCCEIVFDMPDEGKYYSRSPPPGWQVPYAQHKARRVASSTVPPLAEGWLRFGIRRAGSADAYHSSGSASQLIKQPNPGYLTIVSSHHYRHIVHTLLSNGSGRSKKSVQHSTVSATSPHLNCSICAREETGI